MNKFFLATLFATLLTSISFAQEEGHSDIEFGFEDPAAASPVFEIELFEVTSEGIQVAEGEFSGAGAFRTADNPGFITPVEEGLTIGEGDLVSLRVLNMSAADSPTALGSGYVSFWTPDGGLQSFDSSFGTFEFEANTVGSDASSFSVFAGDELISGSADLFLAEGSDGTFVSDPPPSANEEPEDLGVGEIHNHLAFDLTGDLATTPSAVGVLLQFSAVRAGTGEVIDSDPFFLIFNNGLDEEVFEADALLAFGLDEGEEVLLGDANCDGTVNFFDIQPFIDILSGTVEFKAQADIDGNEAVNFFDIAGFIDILSNPGE